MASSTLTTLGVKLTDATQRSFKIGYSMVPMGGRDIFNVGMTDKKVETFNSAEMDQVASATVDGANFASFDATLGDELTLTQAMVTGSFEVTLMGDKFDQYNVLSAMAGGEKLGKATAKRIELDLQQLISQGASSSYTDKDGNTVSCLAADGNPLFYGLHSVNGSSNTYDNVDSTAFGQTGLETVEDLFRNFLNQDGQIIDRRPNVIFSTTKASLVNLIQEYARAPGHPEDAYQGVNVYVNRYSHVPLEYLDCDSSMARDSTKDDYWGLVVAKDENLKLRVSQGPTLYPSQLVQRNRNTLYQASAIYAYGPEDPNVIALSAA
jgi:hypothetical protein